MELSTRSILRKTRPGADWSLKNLLPILLLTIVAFLVMGYHPGLEDDAFYLAAIKRDLNPALFPHDADFFQLQFQATIFDKLVAFSIRLTRLPIDWAVLAWQFAAIFFMLHGCFRIARRCFVRPAAQWSAVAFLAVLLSMPLPGIAINLADQYLHPRTLATALILAAIVAIFDRRILAAIVLLLIAFTIHAIMACFGVSFCAILLWNLNETGPERRAIPIAASALIPLVWLFEPASDAWRKAASTRSFYFVGHWEWYEWLGIFAPLGLLYAFQWFMQHRAERHGEASEDESLLRPMVLSLLYFGLFQTVVGLAIMLPPSLERLRPFEPMRYLHLLYLLFFLIAGGFLGDRVLKRKRLRWLLLFVPLSAGMFLAQIEAFISSPHIEWPGATTRNGWLCGFEWIRQNTPTDALFAINPHYMRLWGEDYHGFRALAERSVLADYDKDAGMAARVPSLAPRWLREVTAETGWAEFKAADFQRLKNQFGVTWVILSPTQDHEGLTCAYENQQVSVCRIY